MQNATLPRSLLSNDFVSVLSDNYFWLVAYRRTGLAGCIPDCWQLLCDLNQEIKKQVAYAPTEL